eukprot:391293_1
MTGKILNALNDYEYASTYPKMTGSGSMPSTHEVHIFMAELNPCEETVATYYKAARDWNAQVYPQLISKGKHNERACTGQMRPGYFLLVFKNALQNTEREVRVMLSSRYVYCNDQQYVIEQCHCDSKWFAKHGLDVLREKIEAKIFGIKGLPMTRDEFEQHPTKYFEYHVKLRCKSAMDKNGFREQNLTNAEVHELKTISKQISHIYKVPMPLSYSISRGHPRFFNLRFRNIGRDESYETVVDIASQIKKHTKYEVIKIIPEYVWYDSYTKLDRGFLEYDLNELKAMFDDKYNNHTQIRRCKL